MRHIYTLFFFFFVSIISFAQVVNDSPCGALSIEVNGPVVASQTTLATVDAGEAIPPAVPSAYSCAYAWCSDDVNVQHSVWFTFVAPPTGAVIISTCTDSTTFDSQLALYSAADCADYTTFQYLASNDDMIEACGLAGPYSSLIEVDGLTPGQVYYVQVDGYANDAGTIGVQITATIPTAEVNFIHNSADAAITEVDIWLGDSLWIDNLNFRTCSGNLRLPADMDITIAVCPSSSVDASTPYVVSVVNLNHAIGYYATVAGIVSTTGYSPAPALSLNWFSGALQLSDVPSNTPVVFFQGVTDAGNWDVMNAQTSALYNDNLNYASYSQEGYIYFPAENTSIEIAQEDGASLGLTYCLPFLVYAPYATAFHIVSSGFLNPVNNSNGPDLGLFIVNPWDGTFIPIDAGLCDIPANDQLCSAATLYVDAQPYAADNSLASVDANESSPTNLPGSDPESDCIAAWCDGTLDNTLWFQFVAPESGCVTISTCFSESIDSQVALCTVSDCNDYSTVSYLAANDDMVGGCNGGNAYASYIEACGLVPGDTYYIQTDGYEGEVGAFQIQVSSFTSVLESSKNTTRIFPNPAKGELNVHLFEDAELKWMDASGRLVRADGLLKSGQHKLLLNGLSPGAYVVMIQGKHHHEVVRVVVE